MIKIPQYDPEARLARSREYAEHLATLLDLQGKRILEVGPHLGDLSSVLARDYGCEVVGIDPQSHPNWPDVMREQPSIRFIRGYTANPPDELAESRFDLVLSFVVWEHIRHPWSALRQCQRLLKPTGKKFLRANLYRSAIASHMSRIISEPWPHLLHSPDELRAKTGLGKLGWAYWVNKLTYQQYLFYFRQLGLFIIHEKFWKGHFDSTYYDTHEHRLGLYPRWDLETDFFEVVLEFDPANPKQPVVDPVYARMPAHPRL